MLIIRQLAESFLHGWMKHDETIESFLKRPTCSKLSPGKPGAVDLFHPAPCIRQGLLRFGSASGPITCGI